MSWLFPNRTTFSGMLPPVFYEQLPSVTPVLSARTYYQSEKIKLALISRPDHNDTGCF